MIVKSQDKINIQKSVAFLYTNDENQKEKIRGEIPFTITTKRIKYLRINLPKETKDPYAETESLMTQTDGEIYHVLGLEESI